MEDALRDRRRDSKVGRQAVLILVLMGDALREAMSTISWCLQDRLNPCSNGRCSAREFISFCKLAPVIVLILVLMEDALRDIQWEATEKIDGTS